MTEIVGYFIWKRYEPKDTVVAYKHEKSMRDYLVSSSNHFDKERHFKGLIIEIPLNDKQFKLSLHELAKLFPCPVMNKPDEKQT